MFLNVLEILSLFVSASESVECPLLSILFEYKQYENYQVAVKIVEIPMLTHIVRRVINTTPEQVKYQAVQSIDDLGFTLVHKGLSDLVNKLCWVYGYHAE